MSSVLLARGLALGSAFACMNTHFSFYFFPENTGTECYLGVGLFVFCLF